MPGDPHVSAARAAEPGRGRDARGPDEIPFLGWRDIFWRVIEAIPADRVLATSGSVAFFTLLAIFPAVATVVSLYGLYADTHTINHHLVLLSGVLPTSAIDLLGGQMTYIAGQRTEHAWTDLPYRPGHSFVERERRCGRTLRCAQYCLQGERETQPRPRLLGTSLLFTLGAIAFTLAAVGFIVLLPVVLDLFKLGTWSERLIAIAAGTVFRSFALDLRTRKGGRNAPG